MRRYHWFVTALAAIVLLSSCVTLQKESVDPMELLRQSVLTKAGDPLSIEAEYLLLYYAADWCPFCVEFTDQLNEQYRGLKRLYGDSVELIFIGHINDQSDEELIAYLSDGEHAFGYLPIALRDQTQVIEKLGEHRFYIPGFVLLDEMGEVIASSNGESIEEYVRDRPIYVLQGIKRTDCVSCPQ
ncbi:MAG TPA: thioredoxin family protein [Sphaerochaeta sp.]|nr:thioredoxin family protein [Sphaerochaeta sp.]